MIAAAAGLGCWARGIVRMVRRRRFLIWLAVLSAVWTFANWPRNGGSLMRFLEWAWLSVDICVLEVRAFGMVQPCCTGRRRRPRGSSSFPRRLALCMVA